jgi:hypothetical protein
LELLEEEDEEEDFEELERLLLVLEQVHGGGDALAEAA